MIRLAVAGASGRMGNRIITLANDIKEIQLTGALEQKGHASIGKDIGEVIGTGTAGVTITDSTKDIIDKFHHHRQQYHPLKNFRTIPSLWS